MEHTTELFFRAILRRFPDNLTAALYSYVGMTRSESDAQAVARGLQSAVSRYEILADNGEVFFKMEFSETAVETLLTQTTLSDRGELNFSLTNLSSSAYWEWVRTPSEHIAIECLTPLFLAHADRSPPRRQGAPRAESV